MSRSNHVAVVAVGDRGRFVAKVGRADAPRWEQGDPAVERRLLRALNRRRGRRWLPEVLACAGDLLVTGLVGTGASVRDQVHDGALTPVDAAVVVGAALGEMLRDAEAPPGLPATLPWVLRLADRPWPSFVTGHDPATALLGAVLDDNVRNALRAAARGWRVDGLTHGDLRWDNCVPARGDGHAVLVDWEFASHGDPAWDLGCALAEHLAWGPLGPMAAPDTAAPAAEVAARAVHDVRAEWTALLAAYLRCGGERAQAVVARTPIWVAVRAFQIAVQWTYWSPDDPARARRLATVASALLADPPEVR